MMVVPVTLLILAVAGVLFSYTKDHEKTRKALTSSLRSFMGLVPFLLSMTALIGLVLALLPPGMLAEVFSHHGAAGFWAISLVGALVTMPAPVAFPLAGSLLHQGVSLSALAAFITTLTMVGIVTAPMEIAAFGRRFTIIRQTLSFILAICIGAVMGRIL
jgi:uncharacterized membrane protein YraQ (UPF0718 family)